MRGESCKQKRSGGFSLVEVMVAAAVVSIVTMGIASVLTNLSRENAAIGEKLTALATESELIRMVQGPDFCGCFMSGASINSTTKAVSSANLQEIPLGYEVGCVPKAAKIASVGQKLNGSHLTVQSIEIASVSDAGVGVGTYSGQLQVQFSNQGMVRGIQPIKIPLSFYVDLTDPANAQSILGCGSPPGSDTARGLEMGIWGGSQNKGDRVVNLPAGRFTTPPIVILQSRWNRESSNEGSVFWVDQVSTSSFRINWKSPNKGDDHGEEGIYWMAFKSAP